MDAAQSAPSAWKPVAPNTYRVSVASAFSTMYWRPVTPLTSASNAARVPFHCVTATVIVVSNVRGVALRLFGRLSARGASYGERSAVSGNIAWFDQIADPARPLEERGGLAARLWRKR